MNVAQTLLLDVGNSSIKSAILTIEGMEGSARAFHNEVDLRAFIEHAWPYTSKPTRVIVANVAGDEIAAKLTACTKSLWNLQPEFVVAQQTACDVINAYSDSHKLGIDRWAALIGARHITQGAVCVVDCGTAITVDTLTAEGQHLGGLILPGLHTMQRSLLNNTRLVLSDEKSTPRTLTPFAKNTEDAVKSGILYAVVAALDRALTDISSGLPVATPIITGGGAEYILPLLARPYQHEPDLVLQGLAVIAQAGSTH